MMHFFDNIGGRVNKVVGLDSVKGAERRGGIIAPLKFLENRFAGHPPFKKISEHTFVNYYIVVFWLTILTACRKNRNTPAESYNSAGWTMFDFIIKSFKPATVKIPETFIFQISCWWLLLIYATHTIPRCRVQPPMEVYRIQQSAIRLQASDLLTRRRIGLLMAAVSSVSTHYSSLPVTLQIIFSMLAN